MTEPRVEYASRVTSSVPDGGALEARILTFFVGRALEASGGEPIVITREEFERQAEDNIANHRGIMMQQDSDPDRITISYEDIDVAEAAIKAERQEYIKERVTDFLAEIFGRDLVSRYPDALATDTAGDETSPLS